MTTNNTNTGRKDAKGRTIWKGPRGGEFVRTPDGRKRVPAKGRGNRSTAATNTGDRNARGRTIFRGPRGGIFVLLPSGRKTRPASTPSAHPSSPHHTRLARFDNVPIDVVRTHIMSKLGPRDAMHLGAASRALHAPAKSHARKALRGLGMAVNATVSATGLKLMRLLKRVILASVSPDPNTRRQTFSVPLTAGLRATAHYTTFGGQHIEVHFIVNNIASVTQTFEMKSTVPGGVATISKARDQGRLKDVTETYSIKPEPAMTHGVLPATTRSFINAVVKSATKQYANTPTQLPWARARGLA